MTRARATLAAAALLAGPVVALHLPSASAELVPGQAEARRSAPIVMTGSQLPAWSHLAAQGLAEPYPSGAKVPTEQFPTPPPGFPISGYDGKRTAHNGRILLQDDARTAVPVDEIAAYRWNGAAWQQVRVQVDERFPNFLANGRSDFSTYSGTDEELTYAWKPDGHSTGDETWKNIFGDCTSRKATSVAEVNAAVAAGLTGLGPQEKPEDYLTSMADPVAGLDDDDEVAFMASDAGPEAPTGTPAPVGTTSGQAVRVVDPLDPGASTFVYLFRQPGGSSFNASSSYVQMQRAANADEYIDRYSFATDGKTVKDTEALGTSNTGYGPNLTGTVCRTAQPNDGGIAVADGVSRPSKDRFPRDAMTVTTQTYKATASGRWMVRGHQVTAPGLRSAFGPDLVSRWKGRAFQQSPDSTISVVGFEDEQVNWEANGALLGWRSGPVRAIREIWGADSGTNVTKTETYYRDADTYAYHVRVHPIPSDGLYTSWDYDPANVSKYYNLVQKDGVDIDGLNDEKAGTSVDQLPGSGIPCPWKGDAPCPGDPAYFDAPDPTFDLPSAINRPEEVAGKNGGLVYVFEFTGATSATNALAVPYYRDDACLDDGTGDHAVPRPWPGERSDDPRVQKGYVDYWKAHGAPDTLTYADLACAKTPEELADPNRPAWKKRPFAAAFGQHGIHFFTTQDSDNAFGPKPLTEIVGQQWRFSVPMATPKNVVAEYGNNVTAKLQAFSAPYGQSPPSSSPSPSPSASPSGSASASPSASATSSSSPSPSASPTTTASATSTATTGPTSGSTTAPPSAASCTPAQRDLQVTYNVPQGQVGHGGTGPVANATQLVTATVTGATPGGTVALEAYQQNHYGTATFDSDGNTKRAVADGNGAATLQLRVSGNTRARARMDSCTFGSEAGYSQGSGPGGNVLYVRTVITFQVSRVDENTLRITGDSLPARPGGLVVNVDCRDARCTSAGNPNGIVLQPRANATDGEFGPADHTFTGFRAGDRVTLYATTGDASTGAGDGQNVAGRSNDRSVLLVR